MNWKQMIDEMRKRGETFESIGKAADMSKGNVHDLTTDDRRSVHYERGVLLVKLHKRVMRRKAKA